MVSLGPEGLCAGGFKRVMCISCRRHVGVHKGRGRSHVDRGRGQKLWFPCGCHK